MITAIKYYSRKPLQLPINIIIRLPYFSFIRETGDYQCIITFGLWLKHKVFNLDKLTYVSNSQSLKSVSGNSRYQFIQGDICDKKKVSQIFKNFKPDIVMHLAAETHVDRSIDKPVNFIQTNVIGTQVMLECAREYWNNHNQKNYRPSSKKP